MRLRVPGAAAGDVDPPMEEFLARCRPFAQALFDGAAWAVALAAAVLVRNEFSFRGIDTRGIAALICLACVFQPLSGIAMGLYVRRWIFGSFDEVAALAKSIAMTTILLFFADVWAPARRPAPKSVALIAGLLAIILTAAVRYGWRLHLDLSRRPHAEACARTLVFGAGDGGVQVVQAMLRDSHSPYFPVALLDDDVNKRKLRIMGVPVVGTRSSIADAAERHSAEALLIAIPSASAQLISELGEVARAAGLKVKVLPPVSQLFTDNVAISDIRDVEIGDLLGRHPIETDVDAIAGYLTGRRVLVTGAGGSIGSELCRQISRFGPAELMMLDRDESALHAVQLSIEGRALLDSPNLILADIRDRDRVRDIFVERRPEVVFHAAALKHLSLLEAAPAEALKTNIWGSSTVLEAARLAGVDRFVNISTDKAAAPQSVLGYSKRIAERLTASMAQRSTGTYLSVRFGNVLGSRGSVLMAFREQVRNGGPITVTHPDVTRYFMTVQEAVQLVIQAGAIGRPGEALVLEMGLPIRIADVARRLAAESPNPVEIVFTGLRPGEKLHEEILGEGEFDDRPVHPMISHVIVPPMTSDRVFALDPSTPSAELTAEMKDLCRTDVIDVRDVPASLEPGTA